MRPASLREAFFGLIPTIQFPLGLNPISEYDKMGVHLSGSVVEPL